MTLLKPGTESVQLIDGPAGELEVSLQAGSEQGPLVTGDITPWLLTPSALWRHHG